MNDSISQVICQTCNDDIYVQSFSDFLTSKEKKLLDKTNMITQLITDPTAQVISEEGFDLTTVIPFGTDDYIQLQSIKDSLLDDVDTVTTVAGNVTNIDDIITDINEQINTSELTKQCLDSINIATADASTRLTAFTSKISSVLNNSSGTLKEMADKYIGIMSADSTARDKVEQIANFCGFTKTNDSQTDDQFLESLTTASVTDCTGINPMKSIGASIVEGFQNIDLSSVKSAVRSTCSAIGKAFTKAGKYIKDHAADAVLNTTRKVLEYTGITNSDFKSLKGGDGTIDNAFTSGYFTSSGISNYSSYIYNRLESGKTWQTFTIGGNNYSTAAQIVLGWLNRAVKNEWQVTDIPGARIYIAKTENDVIQFRIKYRPIDPNAVMYGEDVAYAQDFANFFMTAANASAAFDPTIKGNYALEDDYFFAATGMGKALSYAFCQQLFEGNIGKTFAEESITSGQFRLGIAGLAVGTWSTSTRQYINPQFSGNTVVIGGQPIDDPTNEDFSKMCSMFTAEHDIEIHSHNMTYNSYADAYAIMALYALTAMLLYLSQEDDNGYCPYIHSNVIFRGSYSICTDTQNVNKVFVRTGALLAAAAITVLTVSVIKYKKNLKIRAVTTNLQASIQQDAIKEKLLKGEVVSKEELNSMYKTTRKAVRLNKLSGGFASITTGLSTWGESSLPSLGSSSATQAQSIVTLITGES